MQQVTGDISSVADLEHLKVYFRPNKRVRTFKSSKINEDESAQIPTTNIFGDVSVIKV